MIVIKIDKKVSYMYLFHHIMNYSNAKIYKLTCRITGEIYVGSTVNTLETRLNQHKSTGCSSRQIINRGDYEISLIEDFPCENRSELLQRERLQYDRIPNINKNRPIVTTAEAIESKKIYKHANKDVLYANHKVWRQDHKELISAKNKAYREANKDVLYANHKDWRQDNKELISAKNKAYREANKEIIAIRQKGWRLANKEAIKSRKDARTREQTEQIEMAKYDK